jgi:hypothetical protein
VGEVAERASTNTSDFLDIVVRGEPLPLATVSVSWRRTAPHSLGMPLAMAPAILISARSGTRHAD